MPAKSLFIDTNILVYAHERGNSPKHHLARELVTALWEQDQFPSISLQVLQELFVTLEKKGLALKTCQDVVEDYLHWKVVENDKNLLKQAMLLKRKNKISFWDAMIVAAAQCAQAKILWTEDLQHGQCFGALSIVNPLREK